MKLYFYSEEEFRGWYELMCPALLIKIDVFRFMWGAKVIISPHPDAIGRTMGETYHNFELHGKVKAIDLMPEVMLTRGQMERALSIAEKIGFTGIGLYPDWILDEKIRPGIHLDVRPTRFPSNPVLWGGIKKRFVENGEVKKKQVYVSLHSALSKAKTV